MDTRRLLSSTALYGIADIAVMAVGGFLLLPLYTRTLTQTEFGTYVAVRTNIDILTYLLHFGLVSAVARVYFDQKRLNRHHEYLSSIITFFLVMLTAFGVVLWFWGESLWALLSPTTPAHPYLEFSVAIAAVGFLAAIASLWLRMEGRAVTTVALQLGAAVVLSVTASINLVALGKGLPGLLFALLASATFSAAALPWLFGGNFRIGIRRAYVTESLRYAIPILIGYIAYFVLNRLSTLILQRHVAANELAIFGLAQQLAMIVSIAGTSFGMALQPAVFAAELTQATGIIRRAGRILALLMFGVTSVLVLFATEIFSLVAPKSYEGGYQIMLLLLVANFTNAFTLISDTALLYHRRPKTSVTVSILGAITSIALGLWLIPPYHLNGAAMSLVGAFVARMLLSHWMAYRLTGYASLRSMFGAMLAICTTASITGWIQFQGLPATTAIGAKLVMGALILSTTYLLYRKSSS